MTLVSAQTLVLLLDFSQLCISLAFYIQALAILFASWRCFLAISVIVFFILRVLGAWQLFMAPPYSCFFCCAYGDIAYFG